MTKTGANKTEHSPAESPSLSSYYSDLKIKPASFLKSVRAANIKVFQSQDIAQAQAVFAENDPSLSRTLALDGNRLPEVVERWLMEVAKSAVRTLDPTIMAEESTSGETIFERIVRAQADALQSKNKALRTRAQNLIKLSLMWLIRGRSLDPLQALYALSEIANKRSTRESARIQAQKILLQAKPGQWKALSAVARLSSHLVQQAERTATEAMHAREQLREHVAKLERSVESRQQDIDSLSHELVRLRAELASNTSALKQERELRELDLTHAAGRTRNLLTGRLSLLLSDARDALDFEPPHIEAARQRLDAAKETIAREVNDSND